MKQNTDYGYDIQKLYLEMMLADAGTFVRCQAIFDHTLFDRKLQMSAEFLQQFLAGKSKSFGAIPANTHKLNRCLAGRYG